ncbi:MAG: MFS transporter [Alphaproteobacteria bacterium]
MTAITSASTDDRSNWLGIGYGLMVGALAGYHQFKVPPVLPILLRSYGIDETFGASYMSIYAVVGLLLSGAIGAWQRDRGIAPYLFAGFGFLAAGNALGLAAPNIPALFLASRGCEAIGFSILAINCPLLCARHASASHRMIAVAIGATWIPVGQLFANLLGIVVLADENWQALWWGGLGASLAFAALTWALMRAGLVDLSAPRAPGGAGAAAADRHLMRTVWLVAVLFCLWSIQMIAYLTWLPEVLVSVFALTPDRAALAYTIPVVTVLVFNLVGGALLRRGVPVAPLLAASLALQLAVWLALPYTGSDWTGIASLVVFGIGAGVSPTCLFAMPSLLFGANPPSGAFAALMTGRNLGVLAGPLLLSAAFALTGDWNVASPMFAVSTGLAVAGAIALHRLMRRPA